MHTNLMSGRVAEIGLRYRYDKLVEKALKEGKSEHFYVDKFAKKAMDAFGEELYAESNIERIKSLRPQGIKGILRDFIQSKKQGKTPLTIRVPQEVKRYKQVINNVQWASLGAKLATFRLNGKMTKLLLTQNIKMQSKIMTAKYFANQTNIDNKSRLIASADLLRTVNIVS